MAEGLSPCPGPSTHSTQIQLQAFVHMPPLLQSFRVKVNPQVLVPSLGLGSAEPSLALSSISLPSGEGV